MNATYSYNTHVMNIIIAHVVCHSAMQEEVLKVVLEVESSMRPDITTHCIAQI